jgi:hypothetical protein
MAGWLAEGKLVEGDGGRRGRLGLPAGAAAAVPGENTGKLVLQV